MNWVSKESVLVLEDMVMMVMVIHYGHGYNEVESTKNPVMSYSIPYIMYVRRLCLEDKGNLKMSEYSINHCNHMTFSTSSPSVNSVSCLQVV